jgi:hypothetical protein
MRAILVLIGLLISTAAMAQEIPKGYTYTSAVHREDLTVLIFKGGEHVGTVVCGKALDPKRVAYDWITRPADPVPEKVYTESEVMTILKEKGYAVDEKTTLDSLPLATGK